MYSLQESREDGFAHRGVEVRCCSVAHGRLVRRCGSTERLTLLVNKTRRGLPRRAPPARQAQALWRAGDTRWQEGEPGYFVTAVVVKEEEIGDGRVSRVSRFHPSVAVSSNDNRHATARSGRER